MQSLQLRHTHDASFPPAQESMYPSSTVLEEASDERQGTTVDDAAKEQDESKETSKRAHRRNTSPMAALRGQTPQEVTKTAAPSARPAYPLCDSTAWSCLPLARLHRRPSHLQVPLPSFHRNSVKRPPFYIAPVAVWTSLCRWSHTGDLARRRRSYPLSTKLNVYFAQGPLRGSNPCRTPIFERYLGA